MEAFQRARYWWRRCPPLILLCPNGPGLIGRCLVSVQDAVLP